MNMESIKTFLIIIAVIVACAIGYNAFKFDGEIEKPGMTKKEMQENFENKPYLNR